MGFSIYFLVIAVIKEESIPPDKKVPKGTSELSWFLTELSINFSIYDSIL